MTTLFIDLLFTFLLLSILFLIFWWSWHCGSKWQERQDIKRIEYIQAMQESGWEVGKEVW